MNTVKAQLQKELRDAGWHSRGYLPHFDGGDIAQTITFRLAASPSGPRKMEGRNCQRTSRERRFRSPQEN